MRVQNKLQSTSRRHRRPVHHLHIYREGELGYSVNGIRNKGVCMTGIQDLYQTIHNIISASQGMN